MLSIYDNVLSSSASRYLHAAASLGELGDEHHTAFDRRSQLPATALEACVHSVLRELGDESPSVEYWWRDTWEHVEAHEDVDEYLFERDGTRRYPTHAHVLYLTVGAAVRAPTCVWARAAPSSARRRDFGALTAVPACTGRLLRFDGSLMHAVPRPTLRWLPMETRTGGTARKSRTGRPRAEELVRSVVLFNTWDTPPLKVPKAGGKRDPHAVIDEIASAFSSPKIDALAAAMDEPATACRPFDEWVAVPPRLAARGAAAEHEEGGGGASAMKVWLLGGVERRAQQGKTLELARPDGLAAGLQEERVPTSFVV